MSLSVRGSCPRSITTEPTLHLTADTPAYAVAKCQNGDKPLETSNGVNFLLDGAFDQSYLGLNCLFYKKRDGYTFTVDVEVGWGEPNGQLVQKRKIHTISCTYDRRGWKVAFKKTVSDWILNPWEHPHLLDGNASAILDLQVWDILHERVNGKISTGRKIRLAAFDKKRRYAGFRAFSCLARAGHIKYYMLRAGCGDGLIFSKTEGFVTKPHAVYSPYFDAFELSDTNDTIEFECVFVVCKSRCNGDSCPTSVYWDNRTTRDKFANDAQQPYIIARTGPIQFD